MDVLLLVSSDITVADLNIYTYICNESWHSISEVPLLKWINYNPSVENNKLSKV